MNDGIRNGEGAPSARPPRVPVRGALAVLWASFGFVALRFALTPIRIKLLTTLLPKADYGSLMLISTTVAFLTLALSMGSFEFLLRRLPGRPPGEQGRVFRTVLVLLGSVAGAAALIGGWVLWTWPPAKLSPRFVPAAPAPALLLGLTLLLLACAFGLLGGGRYGRARALQVFASDLWFVPVAALALAGRADMPSVLWAWVGWMVAGLLLGLVWTRPLGWAGARAGRAEAGDILRFGLPLMPMVLGDWLFRVVDQYVLLAVRDTTELASYALAVNTAMVGYFAGTSFVDLLVAEFHRRRNARPDSGGEPAADLRRLFTAMVRCSLAVGLPVAAVLAVAGRPVIRLLSSAAYDDAVRILPWAALQPTLFLLNLVAGRVLAALGESRRVGALTLSAAAVALAVSLWLTPRWGGAGAALANTLALAGLCAALAVRLRPARWLLGAELRAGRLAAAMALISAALATRRGWPAMAPLAEVGALAAVCAAALLATGAVGRRDLALLSGGGENPAHE